MADRIKGITVEIGGDTTGLKKALSSVNKDLSTTQSALKDVNKLLKLDPTNTELLRQKQQLLANQIETTKQKLDTLRKAEEQLKNAGVDKNSAQFQGLQREIIATEQSLGSLREEAVRTNTALATITTTAGNVARTADTVYTKTRRLSAAAAALGAAAVKASADFEQGLSNVEALLNKTLKEGDMDKLREKALQMGETTKFSCTQAAEAMSYMALAGWDAQQIMGGIEGVVYLAAAANEDLATTSDIVTDALTAFGLEAKDANHFADVLAATMASSNTTVSMLGESFKFVGTVAGTAGYSIEDVSLALGLMANSGIKGASAGTQLRQAIANLTKPTKQQAAAMEKLGISLTDSDGHMLTMKQIMDQLRVAFAGLSVDLVDADGNLREYDDIMADLSKTVTDEATAEKMRLAAQAFNTKTMAGVLAIVNADEEAYRQLAETIYGVSDAEESFAKSMQDTQLDNFAGRVTLLGSEMQTAAVVLGDKLIPFMDKLIDIVSAATKWFNSLSDEQVSFIAQCILVVAAIAPVAKGVSSVASGIELLTGTVIPKAITIFGKFSGTAIPSVGKAFTTFLTGPHALLIAGIIALVALIATKGDEIQNVVNKVFDWMTGKLDSAIDYCNAHGLEFIAGFLQNLKNFIGNIKDIFNGIIDFIRGVFTGDWSRAWNGVIEIFKGIFGSIGTIVKSPINAVISGVNKVIGGINKLKSFTGGSAISTIPLLANGGVVSSGSAIVGDAGPELLTMMGGKAVVQPLTNSTTTNTNLGGVTINVYGAAGQNVQELAEVIMDEMQAAVDRRGAVFA